MEKEVDRYLRLGIIRKADPGKCPWASPIVVVTKKENDIAKMLDALRLCKDYRKVNKLTVKDAYPLPRIQDMLIALRKENILHLLTCSWVIIKYLFATRTGLQPLL